MGVARFWIAFTLILLAVAAILSRLGVPSPYVFAGVAAGAAGSLRSANPQPFPEPMRTAGMAIIGVGAGSMIDPGVIDTVLSEPGAVLGGVVATLLLSMAVRQVLRFSPHVNGPTAVLSSIAGGASGVSAMARDVGADEAIVLSIQYLRVLFVLTSVPLGAALFGSAKPAGGAKDQAGGNGIWFTVAALMIGLVLARVLRFSASALVLPLLASTALSLSGLFPSTQVPNAILAVGYAAVGLAVGLSLTRQAVRRLAGLMPLVLVQVVLAVVGCAAVGLLFAELADVSRLDGYLATTPGGLPAVTAIAIGSGASVGLVITMQLVRIFLALLLAPIIAALWRRRRRGGEM